MRSPHSYLPRFILLLLRTRLNSYKLSLLYIRASKAVSSVYHASSKSCTSMAESYHGLPPRATFNHMHSSSSALRHMRSWHASNPCGRRFEEELFSSDPNRFSPLEYTLNAVYVSKTSSCQRSHKHHGIQFRFYHHTKNRVANWLQSCLYYLSLLSFLILFLLHNTVKAFPFLPNAVWDSLDEIRWYCCQCVTLAPFPGFFEVRVFVQMAYLNVFLSCRFNMQKKIKM